MLYISTKTNEKAWTLTSGFALTPNHILPHRRSDRVDVFNVRYPDCGETVRQPCLHKHPTKKIEFRSVLSVVYRSFNQPQYHVVLRRAPQTILVLITTDDMTQVMYSAGSASAARTPRPQTDSAHPRARLVARSISTTTTAATAVRPGRWPLHSRTH